MRKLAIVIFSAALFTTYAAAAEFVVLSSTEKTIAVGSVIADGQNVALPKNKVLMVIDKAGRTITLNGPHKGAIQGKRGEKSDGTLVKVLSSLIRDNEDDARSVGAIRAIDKKRIEDTIDSKESAMVINISETGDYCLLLETVPKVARYHSEKGKNVVLTAVANGVSMAVAWPDTSVTAPWPGDLPVSDGARFLVTQEGKDTRTLITLHQIDGDAPTVAHLAVALVGEECVEQARLMLVHMRRAAQ